MCRVPLNWDCICTRGWTEPAPLQSFPSSGMSFNRNHTRSQSFSPHDATLIAPNNILTEQLTWADGTQRDQSRNWCRIRCVGDGGSNGAQRGVRLRHTLFQKLWCELRLFCNWIKTTRLKKRIRFHDAYLNWKNKKSSIVKVKAALDNWKMRVLTQQGHWALNDAQSCSVTSHQLRLYGLNSAEC